VPPMPPAPGLPPPPALAPAEFAAPDRPAPAAPFPSPPAVAACRPGGTTIAACSGIGRFEEATRAGASSAFQFPVAASARFGDVPATGALDAGGTGSLG